MTENRTLKFGLTAVYIHRQPDDRDAFDDALTQLVGDLGARIFCGHPTQRGTACRHTVERPGTYCQTHAFTEEPW